MDESGPIWPAVLPDEGDEHASLPFFLSEHGALPVDPHELLKPRRPYRNDEAAAVGKLSLQRRRNRGRTRRDEDPVVRRLVRIPV